MDQEVVRSHTVGGARHHHAHATSGHDWPPDSIGQPEDTLVQHRARSPGPVAGTDVRCRDDDDAVAKVGQDEIDAGHRGRIDDPVALQRFAPHSSFTYAREQNSEADILSPHAS